MRINNNIIAMNTHRQYSINTNSVAKSAEKLSSGYRINRAGDDAAGLAISEKMRAQIRGLKMASKNSSDAISLVQTAEGALQESHNILQRMREIAVQSASDTNETSIDRAALEAEFKQLIKEIDDTASKTRFNDQNLIDGTYAPTRTATATGTATTGASAVVVNGLIDAGDYDATAVLNNDGTATLKLNGATAVVNVGDRTIKLGGVTITLDAALVAGDLADPDDLAALIGTVTVTEDSSKPMYIQTGANEGDYLSIDIDKMNSAALNIAGSSVATRATASKAISEVNNALNMVSTQRAALGALQNRLNHKINNLDTSAENLSSAESRIRDLDMAQEMTNFTRNNILTQASTAMLAQANAAPQGVLQLLQ